MGEEFMSLVLTFLAQFKFIFLAMMQIHWVLPRNVSKKKSLTFSASLEFNGFLVC